MNFANGKAVARQTRKRKVVMLSVIAKCLILSLYCLLATGCDALEKAIGPPLPKKDAREYLRDEGVPNTDINNLLELRNIGEDAFETYAKINNTRVRHLVALNTHVPIALLKKLVHDESEFVRQGASRNTSLPYELAQVLQKDKSYRVQGGLVRNPAVPEEMILDIRKTNRKVALVDFAMNPNCPAQIREEIRISNDKLAKHWLAVGLSCRKSPSGRKSDR